MKGYRACETQLCSSPQPCSRHATVLRCGLRSLLLAHVGQTLCLRDIETQALSYPATIIQLSLLKLCCLPELDTLSCATETSDNVTDEVLSILVGHHVMLFWSSPTGAPKAVASVFFFSFIWHVPSCHSS
jgi:hypothetical protein